MRKNKFKQTLTLEEQLHQNNKIDEKFGIMTISQPGKYQGYLYNMRESFFIQKNKQSEQSEQVSALECYFVKLNLEAFKIKIKYEPYALIQCPLQNVDAIVMFLEKQSIRTEKTIREDSSAPNHVAGARTLFLKVTFPNKTKLQNFLSQITENNKYKLKTDIPHILGKHDTIRTFGEFRRSINKVAEWDVPDLVRTAIDKNIRCAEWYDITVNQGNIEMKINTTYNDRLPPKLKVLTYDIETTKQPFCFPNAEQGDKVMCISYMINTQGVLLVNRQIFSQDIDDFEYSPKDDMKAKFKIFNFQNEREVLEFFLQQIIATKPQVISTFNGDNFDFPFIHERCKQLGIDWDSVGFINQRSMGRFGVSSNEYLHNAIVHLDCFKWVQRDSYLPQGNQNLKAVTREKLKYEPMELDPEKMTPYAKQQPQVLAQYSVSDAVATYYLYKKFIESFILALCTIIPLPPDQILRKGTGTLCESLLMVQASNVGLVYPDKISPPTLKIEYIDEKDPVHLEVEKRLEQNPSGYNLNIDKILLHKQVNPNVNVDQIDFSQDIEEDNLIGQLRPGGMKNLLKPIQMSKTAQQRILIQQTYSGGRVEALNAGIYRKDYKYIFGGSQDSVDGYQELIDQLEEDLYFGIYQKFKEEIDKIQLQSRKLSGHNKAENDFFPKQATFIFICKNIQNFDEVYTSIKHQLIELQDKALQGFETNPMIYHLDVSAMYPNIILTNKLQPHAVVTSKDCNSCDYNRLENKCKRQMTWMWRGIYFPCTYQEYQMVLQNLKTEERWLNADESERQDMLKKDLETFSIKNYKVKQKSIEQYHQATICQRENPFYYDTVIQFRDRRYIYKKGQQAANRELAQVQQKIQQLGPTADAFVLQKLQEEVEKWKGKSIYNESLQLAHKAILNSFYGYAMRAGSRWYSIEMAACTTFVGAQIIKMARRIVERVGIPLELDTDGIWCMLPDGFPMNVEYKMMDESILKVEQYTTTVFNSKTAKYFSNDQFQKREEQIQNNTPEHSIGISEVEQQRMEAEKRVIEDLEEKQNPDTAQKHISNIFNISSECTIQFELDGPYAGMFLSAAKEEDKKVKKRYCVFDEKGKISELKGFELKRRGELKLIKAFQERLFPRFLNGTNAEETYKDVGLIASYFLNILRRKGVGYEEELLLDLLSESSTIKNSIENTPPSKKSTAITTAKRLGDSIDQYFKKVAGLNCQFIMSKYPLNTPVSERPIPVQIFTSPAYKRNHYLTEWTKQQQIDLHGDQQGKQKMDEQQDQFNLSSLLDWEYYEKRFINSLMRLIIVPAGIQGISKSPVDGVQFPQWLMKNGTKKINIMDMINRMYKDEQEQYEDEQDNKQLILSKQQHKDESEDEKSSSEQENDNEQKLDNDIDKILIQNNIVVSQNVLKGLYALQFNKVTRDQSAFLWLEKQKNKWTNLLLNHQLNKSLEQLYRDQLYSFNTSNKQRKIISNNIMSQLQGMIIQHNYILLNIKQKGLGVVEVLLFSPKQKEIVQTQISVRKEIIINQNVVDLSTFEDPNILITAVSDLNVEYTKNQQSQFSFIPQGKIKNLFKLEIDEKFYKDNIQFFNQQLTQPNILGVYHKQMSIIERLIIYKGCFIDINPKAAQQLSMGKIDYNDIKNSNLPDPNYLFNFSSGKFIMPVSFCVYIRINEGEILTILTVDKLIIRTSVDLSQSDIDQIFNDFKETIDQMLNQSIGTSNNEKKLLRKILENYQNIKLVSETFKLQPTTNSLFEQLKSEQQFANSIVFYHGTSIFEQEKNKFKQNYLQVGKNNAILADSGLNISDDEVKLTKVLLEEIAIFSQLELYAKISHTPLFNLLFNGGIYSVHQSHKLACMDVLYARELIEKQHVLWIAHDGHADVGKTRLQLELPVEVKSVSNPNFYYTVAAVFDMQYLFAQVIMSELKKDKQKSSQALSGTVQKYLREIPSLLKYLEEYVSNQQSFLYSQRFTNRIITAVNNFLDNIYNISFSQQLIPVHLSCHKLIITSDKIDERLATYKLKSFLEVFDQQFGIIQLDIIQTWRQFFFFDQNNYIGHTLQHTIDVKNIYGSVMSEDYYESANIVLATYLLNINEFINDVYPPVSSKLQLPEIPQASFLYFNIIQRHLLGLNYNFDYSREPNINLLQMKNMSELRLEQFNSPAKQLLSPDQDPGWLYLNYIFGTLALNNHITEQCYNLIMQLKNLFTRAGQKPLQHLISFELRVYCQLCQDYIVLDLTAELSSSKIHCPRCQSTMRKYIIEQLLYIKVQRIFLQQTADRGNILSQLHAIADLYRMHTVQRQIEILQKIL